MYRVGFQVIKNVLPMAESNSKKIQAVLDGVGFDRNMPIMGIWPRLIQSQMIEEFGAGSDASVHLSGRPEMKLDSIIVSRFSSLIHILLYSLIKNVVISQSAVDAG